jgi:hypothetical protein
MIKVHVSQYPLSALVCALLFASAVCANVDDEELHREASWEYPSAEAVRFDLDAWLEQRKLDNETLDNETLDNETLDNETLDNETLDNETLGNEITEQIAKVWQGADQSIGADLLQRVAQTIGLADVEAAALIGVCQAPRSVISAPDCALLTDEATPSVVRDNLRLILGAWLADHQLYNEALQQLGDLTVENVADPGRLLFYQGAVHFRLRDREAGLVALHKLLEQSEAIPQRFATIARLMEADLMSLKTDSLDEVARIMDSIHVRLGHGRAGKRVRQEEDDVVSKLDKMIEQLEEQRQQQQMKQSKDGKGGKQPKSPMQQSKLAEGGGSGDVTPKRFSEDTDWGNLPPKDREEALQQLGNEFPSHYREIIEEYFRNLARKEAKTP